MARIDEIAEGLVSVLKHSSVPEPLGVDLWNYSPAETAFLVRAIIDACETSSIAISTIRIGAELSERLIRSLEMDPLSTESVRIEPNEDLGARIEIYRFVPASN